MSITLGDTVLEDGDEAGLLKMVSYKPGRCLLSGRLHLDASSFVFREG